MSSCRATNAKPCVACGHRPGHTPDGELPLVRGALDAQADAERKWYEARVQLAGAHAELAEERARTANHVACRETEQRLREANRRLQAEGPALERDKVIVALSAEVERLRDLLNRRPPIDPMQKLVP